MKSLHLAAILISVVLLSGICVSAAGGGRDQDLLNQGTVLIFERKWDQAYGVFQRLIGDFPRSPLLSKAYFYSARCLQLQGKEVEALRAYELVLQKFPNDPVLQSQSMNGVVELAASLLDRGNAAYRDRFVAGLKSPNKEVRYFTALRCGRLKDAHVAAMAIPTLREIVAKETEPDLTNRARIALLRLEPKALAREPGTQETREKGSEPASQTRMLHLRVYQNGNSKPVVELNLPLSLAQMAISALDESAKNEMRKKGFDVDNIWEDLKRLGPADILTLRDGEKLIKLWIQ
jgi:tetratricopeptide (TPR) repeat protein